MSHPGTRKHYRARQWQAEERQPKRGRARQYDSAAYDGSEAVAEEQL
jgi:hypothetical protein